METTWTTLLAEEKKKPYFVNTINFTLAERRLGKRIFPPRELVFNAFAKTPFENIRVLILGQDPYHGAGQAEGLCFSVPIGIDSPPSLRNVYKEIATDLSIPVEDFGHGHLGGWAEQGVFLLNSSLTVEEALPNSHANIGWHSFTDEVIRILSREKDNLVFLLWGNFARQKRTLIDQSKHLILEAPHPSPLSAHAGFFGCRHFSKTNEYLARQGLEPIDWRV